ncbi:MAG: N-acetylmuramoyl-L-alanine amidase [Desulforhopalus sp.]
MSSRFLFIIFVIICQIALSPFNLLATGSDTNELDSISNGYEEAKLYYNRLQSDSKISSSRENWIKGTSNFRRIYLSSPKSDFAAACLFMLGRVYGDMYDRFQNELDLEDSLSYFKDMIRLFPDHRLADDGLFALSQIFLDKQNNPQKASDFLTQIISDYPRGDMQPMAEDLLIILAKEHDIALPKSINSSSSDNGLSYVLPVKYWSSDNYTRVVIMASGPVNYKDILLKETENTPRRLYIDFSKSYIEPQYRSPVPIEDGLLRSIRTGQFNSDTVRVVLDIESIDNYKIFNLTDPFRVVIDVRGTEKTAEVIAPKVAAPFAIVSTQKKVKLPLDTSKVSKLVVLRKTPKVAFSSSATETSTEPQPDAFVGAMKLSLAQQLGLGVKKIVIDPGHGGKDPGAIAFGLKEKDIVLDIAQKLAPVLAKELGCEVLLTRESDVFISLEERTAIANSENADLFVSLHVNAHTSANVRGIETYYLNLTADAEAMRVAARENSTSTHQMSDLQDILSDIMKNSKMSESSRLAQQVHNSILAKAKSYGFGDIRNLGVKQAPFYVLIGAEMPAILIEIAFISNEEDVRNLQNAKFITMLTQEIAYGIKTYVSNTTAQL